jgi:hypothetical protein
MSNPTTAPKETTCRQISDNFQTELLIELNACLETLVILHAQESGVMGNIFSDAAALIFLVQEQLKRTCQKVEDAKVILENNLPLASDKALVERKIEVEA